MEIIELKVEENQIDNIDKDRYLEYKGMYIVEDEESKKFRTTMMRDYS